MRFEIIAITSWCVCTLVFSFIVYRMLESVRVHLSSFERIIIRAMDNLKAVNLEERVIADAQEKQYTAQVELLKDAISDDKDPPAEPTYVQTETGEVINLNEYEVM